MTNISKIRMKNKISILFLLFFCSIQINAQILNTNTLHKDTTLYSQRSAKSNDGTAWELFGDKYFYGNGVVKDYNKAKEWYTKAANNGNTNAQYKLGSMYYTGAGVIKDLFTAKEWFSKAAKQHNPQAQYALGWMYENGEL